MKKNYLTQYETYNKNDPPGWLGRWAWRGFWGGCILALIHALTSCNEPPKRTGTILGRVKYDTVQTYHNGSDFIYLTDTLGEYGYSTPGGVTAGGADTLTAPYVYQQQGDSLKIVGGTPLRIEGHSPDCELVLPSKHEILQNEVTKKYCIGSKINGAWKYYWAEGFTDTCELKRYFINAFDDMEETRNSYYKPIKK